jgi:hypothetical protein
MNQQDDYENASATVNMMMEMSESELPNRVSVRHD